MVAAVYPVLGAESKWDARGGNSNAVRNTELMMECNDCAGRLLQGSCQGRLLSEAGAQTVTAPRRRSWSGVLGVLLQSQLSSTTP
jgi:hypothetical protein